MRMRLGSRRTDDGNIRGSLKLGRPQKGTDRDFSNNQGLGQPLRDAAEARQVIQG